MANEQKRKWFLTELLDGYPDVDSLVEKSFSDSFIQSVAFEPSDFLSIILTALSRFVCHVQFNANQLQAKCTRLKRNIEGQKYVTMSSLEGITDRTTSNTMTAKIYKANPGISLLEAELAEAEEQAKFYEKMPDRINEHIQVIKYELRRREHGR
jgi:hypothetical protein